MIYTSVPSPLYSPCPSGLEPFPTKHINHQVDGLGPRWYFWYVCSTQEKAQQSLIIHVAEKK